MNHSLACAHFLFFVLFCFFFFCSCRESSGRKQHASNRASSVTSPLSPRRSELVRISALIVERRSASWLHSHTARRRGTTRCFTWSAVNGYRKNPNAPASIACFTCSSLDSVVIIT